MFLSRVELPWDAARNPYDLHRHLWRLFPGEARETRDSLDAERQGFLFRIEQAPVGRPARVLMQSRHAPQAVHGIALLGTREFCPQPAAGQRLAFVLTANPVKTVVDTEAETKADKLARHARGVDATLRAPKCRVPLIKEEQQREWLTRKLAVAGVVEAASVLPHTPTYFRKGNRGGKLVTASFEGVLHVADPERLRHLLKNGVGPAKAFGCGLLLVRRA